MQINGDANILLFADSYYSQIQKLFHFYFGAIIFWAYLGYLHYLDNAFHQDIHNNTQNKYLHLFTLFQPTWYVKSILRLFYTYLYLFKNKKT